MPHTHFALRQNMHLPKYATVRTEYASPIRHNCASKAPP